MQAAWFQSVTARTAGFNTIDVGGMTQAGLFLAMALMFIGASPGGTGGGVKTTTFSITVAALWATVRGDADTTLFRRRLSADIVAKAFFVSLIAFLGLNLKLLIVGMMFIGRVGPLTLAVALARRQALKPKVRYPEGEVSIG